MPLNKVMRLNFLLTIKKSKINFFFFQTIILFIKSNDFAVFWNYLFSWYNVAFVCQAKRVSIKKKVVNKDHSIICSKESNGWILWDKSLNDEITPSFECVYKYKMPVEYTKHSQWEFSFISIISKKRERKCEK